MIFKPYKTIPEKMCILDFEKEFENKSGLLSNILNIQITEQQEGIYLSGLWKKSQHLYSAEILHAKIWKGKNLVPAICIDNTSPWNALNSLAKLISGQILIFKSEPGIPPHMRLQIKVPELYIDNYNWNLAWKPYAKNKFI